MSKTANIIDFLEAGIRAETLRQKAIASNVANLQTPGYRRVDVQFRDMLAKAIESGDDFDLDELDAEIFSPMDTPVKANGNDVNIEQEVGAMLKNTLTHKAYIRLMNKKYAQMDEAMTIR
jgi:flagellar basal-body rod protein FlgB